MKFLPNFMSKAISKATSFRCGVENFEMFGACSRPRKPEALMHDSSVAVTPDERCASQSSMPCCQQHPYNRHTAHIACVLAELVVLRLQAT
jgi:hypothetical protein